MGIKNAAAAEEDVFESFCWIKSGKNKIKVQYIDETTTAS